MKKNLLIAFTTALFPVLATAQYSVSGKINDKNKNTSLSDVRIGVLKTDKYVQSTASGDYKLDNLKAGTHTIKVNYLGYKAIEYKLILDKDTKLDFELERNNILADGADMAVINRIPYAVTINGIPLNNHENQHAYFIALPDFAYSVDNNQVQRGVGIADNGSGSFGAFICVQNTPRIDAAYGELSNLFGSLNTWRTRLKGGTGLINNKFSVDGRLSYVNSDGYMNSGNSGVQSGFVSGAYYGAKSLLRANVFLGEENTTRAWGGVSSNELQPIRSSNSLTYSGQTDHYVQNHYQLLYAYSFSNKISFSSAIHYSFGRGYYEENPNNQDFSSYNITQTTTTGSLVRRRSLDTDFYGANYAVNYTPTTALKFTLGGYYNRYKGTNFGEILWTQGLPIVNPKRYTQDDAEKMVINAFAQTNYQLGKVSLFVDLQFRRINYTFTGYNGSLGAVQPGDQLNFFNPKVGFSYDLNKQDKLYTSVSISHLEARREQYLNFLAGGKPLSQRLHNIGIGYSTKREKLTLGLDAFGMFYKDQLISNGSSNVLGEFLDQNVPHSSRIGLELEGKIQLHPKLTWGTTAVLSRNTISEFIDKPGTKDEKTYFNTAISYSPNLVAASELAFKPFKKTEIALLNKYVSKQYRDNTSNDDKTIAAFVINDVRLSYTTSFRYLKNIGATLLVNNILGTIYPSSSSNYNYVEKGFLINKDYYFPQQIQRNFLLALNVKF